MRDKDAATIASLQAELKEERAKRESDKVALQAELKEERAKRESDKDELTRRGMTWIEESVQLKINYEIVKQQNITLEQSIEKLQEDAARGGVAMEERAELDSEFNAIKEKLKAAEGKLREANKDHKLALLVSFFCIGKGTHACMVD